MKDYWGNSKQKREKGGKSRDTGLWHLAHMAEDVESGQCVLYFLEQRGEGRKTT